MAGGRDDAVVRNQIEALAKRIIRAAESDQQHSQEHLQQHNTAKSSTDASEEMMERQDYHHDRSAELSRLEKWFFDHGLHSFLFREQHQEVGGA